MRTVLCRARVIDGLGASVILSVGRNSKRGLEAWLSREGGKKAVPASMAFALGVFAEGSPRPVEVVMIPHPSVLEAMRAMVVAGAMGAVKPPRPEPGGHVHRSKAQRDADRAFDDRVEAMLAGRARE